MKKKFVLLWTIAAVALPLSLVVSGAMEKSRVTKGFMRQKLLYSQGILEGITLEKYDLVTRNAILLRNMKLTNTFYFNAEYRQHVTNFHARVDDLYKAATDKNLERTTQSYTLVVGSCVECHQYFRAAQKGGSGRGK